MDTYFLLSALGVSTAKKTSLHKKREREKERII